VTLKGQIRDPNTLRAHLEIGWIYRLRSKGPQYEMAWAIK